MEKLTNKAARRYLRQVRRLLPCSRREKIKITASLCQSLSDFLEEQPLAQTEDVLARFGRPENVAAASLEQMELPTVLQKLRLRRRIWIAAVTVALLMLLAWSGVLLGAYRDFRNDVKNVYQTETITINH